MLLLSLKSYLYSISYIIAIVLVNLAFEHLPLLNIAGSPVSSADILVGGIYVFRDLAQREIKHYILIAMLIGAVLSYWLADHGVAIASLTAFIIGEAIDWSIYSFTRKPLSQRLLLSSAISIPFDSAVFLYMVNSLNWPGFLLLSLCKIVGVILVWYIWTIRNQDSSLVPA